MSEQLKPCPFCGGEVELKYSQLSSLHDFSVYCQNCKLKMNSGIFLNKDVADKKIVAKWNTRHEPKIKEKLEEVFKRR